ncbi:MAG: enoyl-CoA hydratase-related protein [Proteobacteria bacterium]|nr:enoyl-CoA hydratase-related protein [Pseudomonadota bacterium]
MSENGEHSTLDYIPLEGSSFVVAVLRLNRPDFANAFSATMMKEITDFVGQVERNANCRALILMGVGKHFSAGADLKWMKESAGLSYSENLKDSSQLLAMFESIANLKIPTVALVRGAAYGGAVGLIACCDYALAHEDAKFCLSEVKLGLLPAVISPYLLRKMKIGSLNRFSLTARVFNAQEAKESGLVEIVASSDLDEKLGEEVAQLLACSPMAQGSIKVLFNHLRNTSFQQSDETVNAIAKARTSVDGQAGLQAFFNKTSAPWFVKLPHQSLSLFK